MKGFNKASADWSIIKRWNLDEIDKAREELEGLTVSPSRAEQLRGIIHILKEQISSAEPTPRPQVKDENYG